MEKNTLIDGIKVFGTIQGVVTLQDVCSIMINHSTKLHIVRHFTRIDEKSRADLIKENDALPQHSVLTDTILDGLLRTAGSKFNPKLQNIDDVVTNLLLWTKTQIENGLEVVWIEFNSLQGKHYTEISFPINSQQKRELGLLENENLGTLGVVLINKENEHFVQKEQRGNGEKADTIILNILKNLNPQGTDIVTIGLVKDPVTHDVGITSIYTSDGKFSPLFPDAEKQSKEEFEYNKNWWDSYAFYK